jgi:hypothetical protein
MQEGARRRVDIIVTATDVHRRRRLLYTAYIYTEYRPLYAEIASAATTTVWFFKENLAPSFMPTSAVGHKFLTISFSAVNFASSSLLALPLPIRLPRLAVLAGR